MINGVLAAAIMHKLKLEQEVWNVSIFHNEALVSSVISVLRQITSGKKYVGASLSRSSLEARGAKWEQVEGRREVPAGTKHSWGRGHARRARPRRGAGCGCGRHAHTAAITSCGGQPGNETGVGSGSISKTIPSSFPFALSVIPPVCLGKAKPVERLQ